MNLKAGLPETSWQPIRNLKGKKMGDYVARHILAQLPPNKEDKLKRPFTPEDRRRWLEMCCGREAKFHLFSKLSLTVVQGHTHC